MRDSIGTVHANSDLFDLFAVDLYIAEAVHRDAMKIFKDLLSTKTSVKSCLFKQLIRILEQRSSLELLGSLMQHCIRLLMCRL